MDTGADLQCQAILKGLLGLESVLDQPLANQALALADNRNAAREKDLLLRLRRSLVQYLERTGDLVYVALIGHFSSGKSSTVNSLLDLWGSPEERKSGLNPTDKTITLITHEKNADSLLGIVSHGSVPIRLQTVDNPLLSQIVLADTPGTGDPHLIEELARDFLPICDLVLFFFSAASPLDSTDIPLLSELHRRLPFIPLKFIITRADELRRDPTQPVSTSNFDLGKASTFVGEVMSRITLLLQPSSYSSNDFLLIDNKTQLNTDFLKNDLLDRSDPSNVSSRLAMHSHKVSFFQNTAQELRGFFSGFLNEKLTELNRIVAAADRNIQKYNEVVYIANNNLTKSWLDRLTAIRDFKIKATEGIKNLPELSASMFDAQSISKLSIDIRSDIARHTNDAANRVKRHVMQTGFLQLQRELNVIQRRLHEADLDKLAPQDHGVTPIDVAWTLGDTDIVPVNYLMRKADELRDKIRSHVLAIAADTRRPFEEIDRAIRQRLVIEKCEQIVISAQSSLEQDLELYFQNVQVYRAGVFAMTTKASIAKLGIAEELDQLETEFTDEHKEATKLLAKQALFPAFDESVAAAATQLASIADEIRTILSDMTKVRIEPPPSSLARIEAVASEQLATFVIEIKNELRRESGEFISNLQTKLAGVIATILRAYDEDSSVARHARNSRYLMLVGAVLVITSVGYIIFRLVKQPVGQSLLEILGWGLVANLLASAIAFGIARFRDNYPEKKQKIEERHRATLIEQAQSTLDDVGRMHKFSILEESVLSQKLAQIYNSLVNPQADSWQASVEELEAGSQNTTRYVETI